MIMAFGTRIMHYIASMILLAASGQTSASQTIWVVAKTPDKQVVTNASISTVMDGIKSQLAREGFRVISGSSENFTAKEPMLAESEALESFFGQHYILAIEPVIQDAQADFAVIQIKSTTYLSSSNDLLTAWTSTKKKVLFPLSCSRACQGEALLQGFESLTYELQGTLPSLLAKDRSGFSSPSNEKSYVVSILDLSLDARHQLTQIMENEFPNFQRLVNARTNGNLYSFHYFTTAPEHLLIEWMTVALRSLGLEVNKDVSLVMDTRDIQIKKLFLVDPKPLNRNPLFN